MKCLVVLIALVALSVSKPVTDVSATKYKELIVGLPNYTEEKTDLDNHSGALEKFDRTRRQALDIPGGQIILIVLVDGDQNVLNYEEVPEEKVSAVLESVTETIEVGADHATNLAPADTPEVLEAKAQHVAAHTIALARLAQEYQSQIALRRSS